MAVGPLEQAFIELDMDTGKAGTALLSIEQQLEGIERASAASTSQMEADFARMGEQVEDVFRELARSADESLGDIGSFGSFDEIQFQAESAGEAIENAFAEAARSADESLGDIGGGSFAAVRAEAELTGEAIESSFREAGRQSDSHLRGIGRGGSLSLLTTGLFGVAAAAGVAGAATVGFGLKGAAALEQTQIGFESLLGSATEADAFIRDLQQFAANTPFEFQGLADNARRLLAVGEAAGITRDEILPTLTTLGDLVAVLGAPAESIDRVNTALAQMASKGKVSTEELLQLGEALPGFPVFQALADGLGLTGEQLQDKLQAGAIGAQEGIAALLQGMAEFPGAAGAMAKQAQTLTGVFSTFKDTISLSLTEAFQPLVPTIKTQLAAAVPAIEASLATIAPALSSITGGLLGGFGAALSILGPSLGEALAGVGDSFEPLREVGGELLRSIATPLAQLGPLLASLVGAIAPVLGPIATAFSTFATPFLAFLTNIATSLQPVVAGLAELASGIFEALGPAFTEILGSVQLGLQEILGVFTEVDPAPFIELAGSVSDLLIALSPLIPIVTQLAVILLTGLVEALVIVADVMADVIGFLADNQAALIAVGSVIAVALVPALIAWGVSAASAAVATIAATSPLLLIAAAIAALVVGVIWAYQNLGFFRDAVDTVKEGAIALWNDVLVPFAAFMADTFGNVVASVSSFFTDTLVPAVLAVAEGAMNLWTNVLVPFASFIAGVLIPVIQTIAFVVLLPLITVITTVSIVATSLWQLVLVPLAGFLAGVFGPVLSFIGGILAGAFSLAFGAVSAAAGFLWQNILVPLGGFLSGVLSGAISGVSSAWGAMSFIVGAVGGALSGLWNNYLSPVASFLSDVFSGAVSGVADAFGVMGDAIGSVVDFLGDLLGAAGSAIDAIGSVADAISNLPGGGVLDAIGGAFGLGAAGGIFNRPTPMIIGEAGPEVLIPLSDPRRAAALTAQSGLLDVLAGTGAFTSSPASSAAQAAAAAPAGNVLVVNINGDVSVPGAGSLAEADRAGQAWANGAARTLAGRRLTNAALTS